MPAAVKGGRFGYRRRVKPSGVWSHNDWGDGDKTKRPDLQIRGDGQNLTKEGSKLDPGKAGLGRGEFKKRHPRNGFNENPEL